MEWRTTLRRDADTYPVAPWFICASTRWKVVPHDEGYTHCGCFYVLDTESFGPANISCQMRARCVVRKRT